MIKLYHSPRSRSLRIVWLFEELGLPYALESLELEPPAPKPFAQKTPFGKVPVVEDDGMTMFESGAIIQYVLERYGDGRLAPPIGSEERGPFLQWLHFAEATLFTGVGNIAWHTRFREDADEIPQAIEDYRVWLTGALDLVERTLEGGDYLLGETFSAADIAVGYSLFVAQAFGLLGAEYPNTTRYVARLMERPALRKAAAL